MMKRLKELEAESVRLKRMYADECLKRTNEISPIAATQ